MYSNIIMHNANPTGQKIGDCLTRATCTALNVPYKDVEKYLANRSGFFCFDYKKCWGNYFEVFSELGADFVQATGRTLGKLAEEVAALSKAGKAIILLSTHHAVAMVNGAAVDWYDSSSKRSRGYWILEGKTIDTARAKLSPDTINAEKAEAKRKEKETMKEQTTTIEATAAIVPEVLPPEQEQPTTCTALIPAPLKEEKPTALVDVDADTVTLLREQAKMIAALPGVKALELVGRWLWAEFTDKPSEEIREQLKANKWSWAPKKGKWSYHNPKEARPGKHRFMTLEEIKDKYGHAAII